MASTLRCSPDPSRSNKRSESQQNQRHTKSTRRIFTMYRTRHPHVYSKYMVLSRSLPHPSSPTPFPLYVRVPREHSVSKTRRIYCPSTASAPLQNVLQFAKRRLTVRLTPRQMHKNNHARRNIAPNTPVPPPFLPPLPAPPGPHHFDSPAKWSIAY